MSIFRENWLQWNNHLFCPFSLIAISLHDAVPQLFDNIKVTHRQAGLWRGLAGGLDRCLISSGSLSQIYWVLVNIQKGNLSERKSLSRWGMLVDNSPCIQAEIRGWEGQGGRWSHPGQRVLWEISGKARLYIVYSGALQFHLKHLSHQQHLSYASGDLMVDASFMQTLWNMNPVCSGCELAEGKLKAPAFLNPHFICHTTWDILYALGLQDFGKKNRIAIFLIEIAILKCYLTLWCSSCGSQKWPMFYYFNEMNALYFKFDNVFYLIFFIF